jgi:putative DNA primase/helicase
LWQEKLGEWFSNDPEEIAYHQQLAGYFITGETRDPCFAMWHGPGNDGKSTIVRIYKFILGPYAQTTTETAFLETRNGQHSEEIACLRKARLVFISEAGGRWNENRIKAVTGGDQLTASFKFKSVFSYYPEFKPLVTTNEWPWISSTGRAMERRLHVYPFTPTFGEPDTRLDEKLRQIAGAILSWMIEGAVTYYREGLRRSPVVEAANSEYLHEHDILQQFLDEYIEFDPEFKTRTTAIYSGFKQFCDQHGLKPYSLATMTKRLGAKNIECRTAQLAKGEDPKRAYIGIRIRVEIDIDEKY